MLSLKLRLTVCLPLIYGKNWGGVVWSVAAHALALRSSGDLPLRLLVRRREMASEGATLKRTDDLWTELAKGSVRQRPLPTPASSPSLRPPAVGQGQPPRREDTAAPGDRVSAGIPAAFRCEGLWVSYKRLHVDSGELTAALRLNGAPDSASLTAF